MTSQGASGFLGKYSDPSHSGCERTIAYIGGRDLLISGADEDKKPWKVTAKKVDAGRMVVDFTAKGGPPGVTAYQLPQTGDIKFPDGNVWKKIA